MFGAVTNTPELLPPELMARLERLELVTRKVFRGRMKGERRSTRKGESVEFADFRNYVPGDDLRRLDWNLYARLDKLILKLFQEEEDLHVFALVDDSPSMLFGEPTKLDYAKQIAAALGFVGLVKGDRVVIESLSQGLRQRAPVLRGRKSVFRMRGWLEAMGDNPGDRSAEPASLAEGVRRFCLRNAGRGVVVLISDLMDKQGYEAALRLLVARRMDVYVLQVLSREEIDPEIQGDLRLVDCEDGDWAEVTASAPLIKRYKETLSAFTTEAQRFCSQRGMHYLLVDNQTLVATLMTGYLRSRGLVR